MPTRTFLSHSCLAMNACQRLDLQAVDCLVPGSEPTINFLGKIEYWLSLRSLFQPFGVALVPEGA